MNTTKTKRKALANPKKDEHHPDNSLARRVGNHPQLAAWWGRISGEIHWVQDELTCGSGPFENIDRALAQELVQLLERAWNELASQVPFGPPAEFCG